MVLRLEAADGQPGIWRWRLFGLCGGTILSYVVCAVVDAVANWNMGPPTLTTPSGITRLWSRRYECIPHLSDEPWHLHDDTRIEGDSLVFETHLCTSALRRARCSGLSVGQIDRQETLELVTLLHDRCEIAMVGRATMRERLSSMGWSVRETPRGLYRNCDTFFRKLYLLAARGPARAARDEGPVAEVAISLSYFIARAHNAYSERGARPRANFGISPPSVRDNPRGANPANGIPAKERT